MKYKILILTCFVLILFSVTSTYAMEDTNQTLLIDENPSIEVNDTDILGVNENDEILSANDGSYASLQQKIDNAPEGSEIILDRDYTNNNENPISINKGITINGNGHTINANKHDFFTFSLSGGVISGVTFKNIKFINAEITSFNSAGHMANYYNCIFNNNKAAFGIINSAHTVKGCNFTNNAGIFGLVYNTAYVYDCNFVNNKGGSTAMDFHEYGHTTGASCIYHVYYNVDGCTFSGNTGEEVAVICSHFNTFSVTNSKFIDNVATYGYQGCLIRGDEVVNIQNCVFTNNRPNYVTPRASTGLTLTVPNPKISVGDVLSFSVDVVSGVTGTVTAKIASKTYTATLTNSHAEFSIPDLVAGCYNLLVSVSGNDIYSYSSVSKYITVGSTFDDLQNLIDTLSDGDSLVLDDDYTYSTEDTVNTVLINKMIGIDGNGHTINGNNMVRIFEVNRDFCLNNTVLMNGFIDDSYGGAIFTDSGNLNINNCSFINNHASQGGAIYCYWANANVKGSTFRDNFCDGKWAYGGAIYSSSLHTVNVEDCTFTNNKCNGTWAYGGAIYSDNINVYNSTFNENLLSGNFADGGALFADNELYIVNSNFISNSPNNLNKKSKTILDLSVSNSVIYDGEALYIDINATAGATGTVIINIGPYIYAYGLNGNPIQIDVPDLAAGNYELTVTYSGDEIYDSVQKSIPIRVVSTFNSLQNLINNCGDEVLYLESDFVYNELTDNPLFIYKSIRINGNNHIIDANNKVRIFTIGSSNVIFDNISFYNGNSNEGGAICSGMENITILNSKFINNTANYGGAIWGKFNVVNSMFINNTAIYNGGGIYSNNGINIINSTFINNIPNDIYPKFNSDIQVNAPSLIYAGNILTIDVNLNSGTTGTVTAIVGSDEYMAYLIDNHAQINIPDLELGNYEIAIIYSGDSFYNPTSENIEVSVEEEPPYVVVSADEICYGEDLIVNLLSNMPDGEAYVTVDDLNYTVNLINGMGELNVPYLESGKYEIKVYYGMIVNSTKVNVNKAPAQIKAIANAINYNQDLVVDVQLPYDVTRRPTVTIEGVSKLVSLRDGIGSVKFSGLTGGSHVIEVTYGGDKNYLLSSANISAQVNRITPKLEVTVDNIDYGENLIIDVKMPSDISRRPIVKLDEQTKYLTLKNGSASAKFTNVAAGIHSVEVSYNGDVNYLKTSFAKTIIVNRVAPQIEVTSQDTITHDETLNINIQLPSDASRRVKVVIDNQAKYATLNKGKALVKYNNLASGTHTIEVSYVGDENYLKTSVVKTIKVNRATPEINIVADDIDYGDVLNVGVQMPADVSRRVVVKLDNQSQTVSLKNGEAIIKFTDLSVGTHTIEVSYAGDENYLKTSVVKTIKVNKATPEINIVADDIDYGDALNVGIQLPADVSRRAVVAIGDQSQTVSLKNGVGNVVFDGLDMGYHEIIVSYNGDSNYKSSTQSKIIYVR